MPPVTNIAADLRAWADGMYSTEATAELRATCGSTAIGTLPMFPQTQSCKRSARPAARLTSPAQCGGWFQP